MDKEQTLKQRFESMNTGETIVTKANKRAVIFVTAKRAKITVTTKEVDGCFHVTKTGEITAPIEAPKPKPQRTLADQIRDLSAADRLALFEHFELCCGMNRGACICEPETVEIAKPLPTITDERKSVLNALQAKIDGIQTGSIAPEIVEEWKFTKATPQFADNGNVYRQQFRVSNGKPVYRNVEVDVDDLEQVK